MVAWTRSHYTSPTSPSSDDLSWRRTQRHRVTRSTTHAREEGMPTHVRDLFLRQPLQHYLQHC
ncbi:hypothetical protein BD309DRAFT_944379 [Dichomitus squalens]|nr:hypothetical protein BD309DRAFT_944379 [Dichomitus squalens]